MFKTLLLGSACTLLAFTPSRTEIEEQGFLPADLETPACVFSEIDSEGFEEGWGIWHDGGSDAFRYENRRFAANGRYSLLLRDNSRGSDAYTEELDFSPFGQVKVSFSVLAEELEPGESFLLELSLDGGRNYDLVKEWEEGKDFRNGIRVQKEMVIDGPFSSSTRLRFRADASSNRDYVFIDDIQIAACKESAGTTGGVTATYFNNMDFTGETVERIDPNIDFDWNRASPDRRIDDNTFSARWEGALTAPTSGRYTFFANTDDGVRVWINGEAIIDDWSIHPAWESTGSIELEAGEKVPFRMDYYENGGHAVAQLSWKGPGGTKEIIPSQYFSPEYQGAVSFPIQNTGFLATYYDDKDLQEEALKRTDRIINFNWRNAAPDPKMGRNTFSVRWLGSIKVPTSGEYTFYARTDDGVRLWVNKHMIADDWSLHAAKETVGTINLEAGEMIPFQMEYFENEGQAVAQLYWSGPGVEKQVLPSSFMYPEHDGVILKPFEVIVKTSEGTECGDGGSVSIESSEGEVTIYDESGNKVENESQLPAGTYSWIALSGFEEKKGTFEIKGRFDLPEITEVKAFDLSSCEGSDGRIRIRYTPNPSRSRIEFSLDGGNSFPYRNPAGQSRINIRELEAGTYSLVARWGNDECPIELGELTLNAPETPKPTIDPLGDVLTSSGLQTLSANPEGGTWGGAATEGGSFDPSQGVGTYEVTYTLSDDKGCSATATIAIYVGEGADTQAPETPINLKALNITETSVDLNWEGADDNMGTVLYQLYQNGSDIPFDELEGTFYNWSNLQPGTTYQIAVSAADAAGNISAQSQALEFTTLSPLAVCENPINLAFNQLTRQSSTYGAGAANLAVDGNTTGASPWTADLQHTLEEFNPWWEVDLGKRSLIKELILFNRSGLLQERLQKFYVIVSDNPFSASTPLNELIADPEISSLYLADPVGTQQVIPMDLEGRFVRIQLTGESTLHMAEVQVLGCPIQEPCPTATVTLEPIGPFLENEGIQQLTASPAGGIWYGPVSETGLFDPSRGVGSYELVYAYTHSGGCMDYERIEVEVYPAGSNCDAPVNLALGKLAAQSSTYGSGSASVAVDGVTTGASPWTPDLAHTETESQPWWQVDLGTLSHIKQVRIYNRSDCCFNRLANFYILTSKEPFEAGAALEDLLDNPNVNSSFQEGPATLENTYQLVDEARYVRIQLIGTNPLHVAEIEVLGCLSANDPCFGLAQASIDPVEPMEPGAGVVQLSATPLGGTWSGEVTPSGTFDPGDCPGTYQAVYTYTAQNGCSTSDTLTILVQPTIMDVFIYAGQSNAAGTNGGSANLFIGANPIDPQISYAWNLPGNQTSGWDDLQILQYSSNQFGHGAEMGFARKLYEMGYNNLGIVKVAKGGTNLNSNWAPNSPLSGYDEGSQNGMYPEMRNFVNTQLEILSGNIPASAGGGNSSSTRFTHPIPYRIAGFLWHQGEGDINPSMAPQYEQNLIEFIQALRTDFGPDLKVFMASVYNPNATEAEGEVVRQAQRDVADTDPLVYIVNLDSIYYDEQGQPSTQYLIKDQLHYNSEGLVKVGESFAHAIRTHAPAGACFENVPGLCETPVNLALGKPAMQSSTYGLGEASLAVDGNIAGSSPWTPDLAHTEVEFQPWWQVDLGSISTIEQVKIYNRNDCCFGRLNNFSILISDTPFDVNASLEELRADPAITNIVFSGSAGLLETIDVGTTGRYVRIHHSRDIQLHIAEVEVIGCSEASTAQRFDLANEETDAVRPSPGIEVFPNPTQNLFSIRPNASVPAGILEYSLYSVTGQLVWQGRGQKGKTTSVNVSELSRGTYFLQVAGLDWREVKKIHLK